MQRQVRVCTQTGGCASSAQEASPQTFELYDRHGRLHQVIEPSGAGGALVTTTYGYDVGNRLRSVSMAGQNRTFSYDPRGSLAAECHPEKGATGNGCVTYSNYDALGDPGR